MIKQWAFAASLSAATLMSSQVFAAREEHEFEISVNIPTLSFYVIPSNGLDSSRTDIAVESSYFNLGRFAQVFRRQARHQRD
ncbi:hypothetical protein ABIA60_005820 [Pseudomonas frederiksbergensis]